MKAELALRHSSGVCRVLLVEDLLSEPSGLIEAIPASSRVFLLTDPNVEPLWAGPVARLLAQAGRQVRQTVLPAGEENKTLVTVAAALDELLGGGVRRDDRVVALGGGVLGDEAGLVAALALRGVPCIQVPTTLLAMADSSVGGKVGVDHPSGKNRIGTFSQPDRVVISPVFLSTLPEREIRAGLFEALKAAFLEGEGAMTALERLLAQGERQPADFLPVIENAVRLKGRVVEEDEREAGLRRILNLGHTIGHALEGATGYGRFLHGEAIGWGMLAALELSERFAGLPSSEKSRLAAAIEAVGRRPGVDDLGFSRLVPFLATDKKETSAGGLAWVLLRGVGCPEIRSGIDPREVEAAWERVRSRPARPVR